MDICHLTRREARKFERCGRLPIHSNHRHVSFEEARVKVGKHEGHGDSTARWVGTAFRMIVDLPLTSSCASPASITEADMLAAVGITKGPGGVNRARVNAARAKIEAFRASPRVRGVQELSVAAVTSAGGCGASAAD
jgi:hypothetical protein